MVTFRFLFRFPLFPTSDLIGQHTDGVSTNMNYRIKRERERDREGERGGGRKEARGREMNTFEKKLRLISNRKPYMIYLF